jgi:hypothetical protein
MTFGEFRFLSFSPRMRLVRVPRRSSSSDVDNLDAALWAEAKMDADIREEIHWWRRLSKRILIGRVVAVLDGRVKKGKFIGLEFESRTGQTYAQ